MKADDGWQEPTATLTEGRVQRLRHRLNTKWPTIVQLVEFSSLSRGRSQTLKSHSFPKTQKKDSLDHAHFPGMFVELMIFPWMDLQAKMQSSLGAPGSSHNCK